MQETTHPRDVEQIDKLMYNYDQIVKISENLGCLEEAIEVKYQHIKRAVIHIKTGGECL